MKRTQWQPNRRVILSNLILRKSTIYKTFLGYTTQTIPNLDGRTLVIEVRLDNGQLAKASANRINYVGGE
jgi:hypothetical protein